MANNIDLTLTLDPHNANLGTPRGTDLLDEALEVCGAGRSILVDKHGVVIAGNKTLVAARKRGLPVKVVPTDGQSLVVVQRQDLDLLEDPTARQLAYYDNRVGEVDLLWSAPQIADDVLSGVNVECAFFPAEIDRITAPLDAVDAVPMADLPDTLAVLQASDLPDLPTEKPVKAPSHLFVFDTIEQRLRWAGFLRLLRDMYPGMRTPERRLGQYLETLGFLEPDPPVEEPIADDEEDA